MRAHTAVIAALAAILLRSGAAGADDWDSAAAGDVGFFASNVMAHGSEQVHDLATVGGVPDQDWYRLTVRPRSSYEMVIDGQTGDVGLQPAGFQRVAQFGTVLQDATTDDFGGVLRLAWSQGPASGTQLVRVQDAACDTMVGACSRDDRYRIRFYETTYTIPRFNNTATQTTVLLVQNTTDRTCAVVYHLISSTGSVVEVAGTFDPRRIQVLNTALHAPNRSGAVRVAHDCGYGAFTGKAVAIEPATGFTFDTPMQQRVN